METGVLIQAGLIVTNHVVQGISIVRDFVTTQFLNQTERIAPKMDSIHMMIMDKVLTQE